jgi:methylmalonyl-CoA mutase cobalamin-binding subunit
MKAVLPALVDLVPERMKPGADLIAEGKALSRDWRVGGNVFLETNNVTSEAEYKRRKAAEGKIMQHAHIGFRSVERTVDAIGEVHGTCASRGVTVDRFGITLDWSMGYPVALRKDRPKGTGIVLNGAEDFARITNAAPAAAHFGDFMLGLPGAIENTKGALAAGATAIGNLGQYFTFRLPYWDDDVATTEAAVTALGLIAAQDQEVLVHSNLDDGFAGLFADMSSALGMVLIERHIVEHLIGGRMSHCFGHHYTAPLIRMAFHKALATFSDAPGTMLFGNTVSYKSSPAGNFASLASYLQADIWALARIPTGHAINPVPVTENQRIPDIDEIIDAQTFATRMAEHAIPTARLIDLAQVDKAADDLMEAGQRFSQNVLSGLEEAGVNINDAAALMLALRRVGPKQLESLYGAGNEDATAWGGRRSVMLAEWVEELEESAHEWIKRVPEAVHTTIAESGLRGCVASSDVHEHGKNLIERLLGMSSIGIIDGGTSADPEAVVATALAEKADFIAISTYNGIALRYARDVLAALKEAGSDMPVLIGGRLNEIPEDSNSGLPVDVKADIEALGALPCETPETMTKFIENFINTKNEGTRT